MAWTTIAELPITSTAEAGVPFYLPLLGYEPAFAVEYVPTVATPPTWTEIARVRLYQGVDGIAVAQEDIPLIFAPVSHTVLFPRLVYVDSGLQAQPWGVQVWTTQVTPQGIFRIKNNADFGTILLGS